MERTAFTYHPPPGGDISLRSSDGTVFLTHTLFLSMASSVFAGMFSTANKSDVVELGDDAESVSLMLRFIYPPTFMDNLPLELIEKSLRMAQKYDVAGIITSIDHIFIGHAREAKSLVSEETIRVFGLAVTYGLSNTRKAALEYLRPGHFYIDYPGEVKSLAEILPSASDLIGVLGAHCIRARGLAKLFFEDNCYSLRVDEVALMCSDCLGGRVLEPGDKYRPSWLPHWNIMAFNRLIRESWEDCEDLHADLSLESIRLLRGVCSKCISVARTAENGNLFESFAVDILLQAKDIIDASESLYTL